MVFLTYAALYCLYRAKLEVASCVKPAFQIGLAGVSKLNSSTTLYPMKSSMEAGSSAILAVTPARQQFHESAVKGWVRYDTTGSTEINASYNVSSEPNVGSPPAV